MSDVEQLQVLAERIRGSDILGRSHLIRHLFDFLIECSSCGRAPKETEVAVEVFGKSTSFDVAQDALVRVYVHKLRRKLDEYYSTAGRGERFRLCIPKGAYRFVVAEHGRAAPQVAAAPDPAAASVIPSATAPPAPIGPTRGASRTPHWLAAALVASVLVNIALLISFHRFGTGAGFFGGAGARAGAGAGSIAGAGAASLAGAGAGAASVAGSESLAGAGSLAAAGRATSDVARASLSPLWARILADDRPILLVFGDYYLFGEMNSRMEVTRLVRQFYINSAEDLDQYLKFHPELADRYMDMQLQYLPTSTAYAMRDLMPLLSPAQRRIQIVLASQLNPDMLKSADVVYIGYLSGMGMLSDLVFAGSRFTVGASYDELVDRTTGRHYVSEAVMPVPDEQKYHDYGYFADFAGPAGNQIMVIAGTRDVAVMDTAESVTHSAGLGQLLARAGTDRSFEALYDVFGMDGTNLDGRVLLTGKLDTSRIWTEGAAGQAATTASRLDSSGGVLSPASIP